MLAVRLSRSSETESRGAADGPLRRNTPNEENNWGMDESIDVNAVSMIVLRAILTTRVAQIATFRNSVLYTTQVFIVTVSNIVNMEALVTFSDHNHAPTISIYPR